MLEREMKELRSVQKEIRAMNESLVLLTNELRHTNEHMKSRRKAAFLMHFCSYAERKRRKSRRKGMRAPTVYRNNDARKPPFGGFLSGPRGVENFARRGAPELGADGVLDVRRSYALF